LSKDEVEKMQQDAEVHASEDAQRRDEVETRNTADTSAYTAEKTLRENKDKISDELNQEVEGKVEAVRSALQGTDMDALRQSTQELNETMQKVGVAVYQQEPPPSTGEEASPEGEQPPEPEAEGEGTVEGEFREV
jgi:molecular chaperone DnaK